MDLFKSKADRNLYIKLNAERQIEWEKGLTYFDTQFQTYKPTLQALNPRTMDEAMGISIRQVESDEKKGLLRYSMEDLLTLNREELIEIEQARHKKWCEEFEKLKQ